MQALVLRDAACFVGAVVAFLAFNGWQNPDVFPFYVDAKLVGWVLTAGYGVGLVFGFLRLYRQRRELNARKAELRTRFAYPSS